MDFVQLPCVSVSSYSYSSLGDFKHNKWIFFIVLAAITGAISGLYDKYLMKSLNPMLVQSSQLSNVCYEKAEEIHIEKLRIAGNSLMDEILSNEIN